MATQHLPGCLGWERFVKPKAFFEDAVWEQKANELASHYFMQTTPAQ